MAEGSTQERNRKNALLESPWDVRETEGTASRCFRHEVCRARGAGWQQRIRRLWGRRQCLGGLFALTACRQERGWSFRTRRRVVRGDMPGLVVLRALEEPQDSREIWVSAAFILFLVAASSSFIELRSKNPLISCSKSRSDICGNEEEGDDKQVS